MFWTCVTWPVPWQFGHVTGFVPGFAPLPLQVVHFSFLFITNSFFIPEYASSKVISKSCLKSLPLLGPFLLLLPEEPPNPEKNELNISPKSPKPLNPSNPLEVYE